MNILTRIIESVLISKPSSTNPSSFDLFSINKGIYKTTYKGIKCLKCPFDYVMYQMLLWEVKPDLVIEIGTLSGGATIYIADILDGIGKGIVHSIDIADLSDAKTKKHKRIKLFYDGWDKYDINLARKYKKILVIDDGAHTYEQVRDALKKFYPLVSKNSYYIVEDGNLTELKMPIKYHGGPSRATLEFMSTHPNFIVDHKWADMYGINATYNLNGYLKRIS